MRHEKSRHENIREFLVFDYPKGLYEHVNASVDGHLRFVFECAQRLDDCWQISIVQQSITKNLIDFLVSRRKDILNVKQCLVRIFRITQHQVDLSWTITIKSFDLKVINYSDVKETTCLSIYTQKSLK